MARKFPVETLNKCIELVQAGYSINLIARTVGWKSDTVSKHLKGAGIEITKHGKRIMTNDAEIVRLYVSGVPEYAIAKQLGLGRAVVASRLVANGIQRRGLKEAGLNRFAHMAAEERKSVTEAANRAWRGTKRPDSFSQTMAKRRESGSIRINIDSCEDKLSEHLAALGVEHIRQKAADIYNIDIAVGPVAVEVTRGTVKYRGGSAKESKRLVKLAELGYRILAVEASDEEALVAHLDDVVAEIERLRGLPSFEGKYRMVRCGRKDCAVIRNELGQFASVPAPVELFYTAKDIELRIAGEA